jgi:hypothetical protein
MIKLNQSIEAKQKLSKIRQLLFKLLELVVYRLVTFLYDLHGAIIYLNLVQF